MRLEVFTPTARLVSAEVSKILAEGTEGSFALLPRHVDVVAALVPGLLSYVDAAGHEAFLGVDEGVLVKCGAEVSVCVLGGFHSKELSQLRAEVQRRFLTLDEHERGARTALARLEAGAIRGVMEIER
jgi:F-type H+-transporting ATPase subunit epsilon